MKLSAPNLVKKTFLAKWTSNLAFLKYDFAVWIIIMSIFPAYISISDDHNYLLFSRQLLHNYEAVIKIVILWIVLNTVQGVLRTIK